MGYLLQNWWQLLVAVIGGGLLGVLLMALVVANAEDEVRADMEERVMRPEEIAAKLLELRGKPDCTVPPAMAVVAGDERKDGAA